MLLGLTMTVATALMAMIVPLSSSTGIVNLLFLFVGIEGLVTGLVGWNPAYALFGFSTNGKVGA